MVTSGIQPLRVLLVEDNPADARLVEEMLKETGPTPISLVHAGRLRQALNYLQSEGFNAVLLDLSLPDSAGLDTFVTARKAAPGAPIVVLTGLLDEEVAVRAVREGAQDYLVKGQVDGPLLYHSIRYAIERHRVEDELRVSEAKYRSLVDGSIQGILIHVDGVIKLANPALARLFNADSAEALIGQSIWPLIVEHDSERVRAFTRARLEGREAPSRYEMRIQTGDNRALSLDCYETTIEWEGKRAILATVVDITDLRKTEEQFRQAQRMEAVGRLAGGIAHDFNNLLTAILGYTELVMSDLGTEHACASDMSEIRSAGQSAVRLTRQLLAFSRRQILQPRVLDLNQVISRMDALLRRVIGEDIALETRLGNALNRVNADPGQIEQVLMNLVVNARDAMPEGGKLMIETANVDLDESYASRHPSTSPGRHVLLAVTDTGIGMSEETVRRLFEPFFTTKEAGKGTGLGLATVYGIVKQSQGSIWVYSEPDHGSTFKIYLPAAAADADAEAMPEDVPRPLSGTETILVVEDQLEVRGIIRATLLRNGYTVLEATTGEEALAVSRGHTSPIHLLFTDVVMPGLSGRRLAQTLAGERPGLRVIYTSGYTDDAIVRHGVLEPGLAFLQKPYTSNALLRKVREVLEAPQPPAV
jgi:PAS domain S-box-containing protein